jgi:hypothetical protein
MRPDMLGSKLHVLYQGYQLCCLCVTLSSLVSQKEWKYSSMHYKYRREMELSGHSSKFLSHYSWEEAPKYILNGMMCRNNFRVCKSVHHHTFN